MAASSPPPYICSAQPSPPDARDLILSHRDCPQTPPPVLDWRPFLLPVRDQGAQGSCMAHAAAAMKEFQELIDVDLKQALSPQYIYDHRRNRWDQNPHNDDGMCSRDCMKILFWRGVCLERSYAYGKTTRMTLAILNEARQHRIKGYAAIRSATMLKAALACYGPCIITVPVYHHQEDMWKPLHRGQRPLGGHAMLVVGYTSSSFIIRNSWGVGWGDCGYCYYSFDDYGAHWEVWATLDRMNGTGRRRSAMTALLESDDDALSNDDGDLPLKDDDEAPSLLAAWGRFWTSALTAVRGAFAAAFHDIQIVIATPFHNRH